jgi:hypothetical protein
MPSLRRSTIAALRQPEPSDDDWYANLLWVERQKCLLFTHAGTLFSVFVAGVRKADLRPRALPGQSHRQGASLRLADGRSRPSQL